MQLDYKLDRSFNEIENNNRIFEALLESLYNDAPHLKSEAIDFIREIDQMAVYEAENNSDVGLFDKLKTVRHDHMKVDLVTDKMIEDAGLPRVSSSIPFDREGTPSPNGVFSIEIFGSTKEERTNNCAYIDLGGKFFHPYAYEILVKLDAKIDKCAKGEGSWEIKDGKLVAKESDPDDFFDSADTGLIWLIENFHKLQFERNTSRIRDERLDFIESIIKDGSIFITKYIVIPVIYRDIEHSSSRTQINEINDFYDKLISYANSNGDELIGSVGNVTQYRIQSTLVQIRKYGQSLISMKNGFFHKAILGKNPDYGSRSVISVPLMSGLKNPSEINIDMQHTGIPIAQCCSLGFPFVLKWISDFVAENFEYKYGNKYPTLMPDGTRKFVELDNPREYFNQEFITKKISLYTKTFSSRFEPVELPLKSGGMLRVHAADFLKDDKMNKSAIGDRYFTWTDLLYLASAIALKDKYVYICRYPITDYLSMFPSKIFVLSTLKTMRVEYDKMIFKNYPMIDLKTSPDNMNTIFNDTVNMSNLYLDTMGADYDGDTVALKMVFSDEANIEAERLSNGIANYFRINGNMVRFIKNELLVCYYSMSVY